MSTAYASRFVAVAFLVGGNWQLTRQLQFKSVTPKPVQQISSNFEKDIKKKG